MMASKRGWRSSTATAGCCGHVSIEVRVCDRSPRGVIDRRGFPIFSALTTARPVPACVQSEFGGRGVRLRCEGATWAEKAAGAVDEQYEASTRGVRGGMDDGGRRVGSTESDGELPGDYRGMGGEGAVCVRSRRLRQKMDGRVLSGSLVLMLAAGAALLAGACWLSLSSCVAHPAPGPGSGPVTGCERASGTVSVSSHAVPPPASAQNKLAQQGPAETETDASQKRSRARAYAFLLTMHHALDSRPASRLASGLLLPAS